MLDSCSKADHVLYATKHSREKSFAVKNFICRENFCRIVDNYTHVVTRLKIVCDMWIIVQIWKTAILAQVRFCGVILATSRELAVWLWQFHHAYTNRSIKGLVVPEQRLLACRTSATVQPWREEGSKIFTNTEIAMYSSIHYAMFHVAS